MIKENTKELFNQLRLVDNEFKEHLKVKIKLVRDLKRARFYLRFEPFYPTTSVSSLEVKAKKRELLSHFSYLLKKNTDEYFQTVLRELIFEYLIAEDFRKLEVIINKYRFFYRGRLFREIRREQLILFNLQNSIFLSHVAESNILLSIDRAIARLSDEVLKMRYFICKEALYGHRSSTFTIEDVETFYTDFKYLNHINTNPRKIFRYPFWDF
jgi:hypothetical protein